MMNLIPHSEIRRAGVFFAIVEEAEYAKTILDRHHDEVARLNSFFAIVPADTIQVQMFAHKLLSDAAGAEVVRRTADETASVDEDDDREACYFSMKKMISKETNPLWAASTPARTH